MVPMLQTKHQKPSSSTTVGRLI